MLKQLLKKKKHIPIPKNNHSVVYLKNLKSNGGYIEIKYKNEYYYMDNYHSTNNHFYERTNKEIRYFNSTIDLHVTYIKLRAKRAESWNDVCYGAKRMHKCILVNMSNQTLEMLINMHNNSSITENEGRVLESVFLGPLKSRLKGNAN